MPRDSSGNYTLPAGINPVVSNTLIDVDWANPTLNDIATQLNNVLTRDGLLGPVVPFKIQDGTSSLPGLSFASQSGTGLFRPTATNALGFSVLGVEVGRFVTTGLTVTGALIATGNTVLGDAATDTLNVGNGGIVKDASGNVGIGTSTPFFVTANRTTVAINGVSSAMLGLGVGGTGYASFYADSSALNMGHSTGYMTFASTGVERMRIESSGDVKFGVITPGINPDHGVIFNDPVGATQVGIGHGAGTTSGTTYLNFNYAGIGIGSITQNGTTAVQFNTTSDYRLKSISGDLQGSGMFIDALQPRYGTWKVDGSPFVGFVAHELQQVSPSSVTGEKDGEQMQSVAYGSAELIANIVAELKTLRLRVASLGA
jgi:hypothetical protein